MLRQPLLLALLFLTTVVHANDGRRCAEFTLPEAVAARSRVIRALEGLIYEPTPSRVRVSLATLSAERLDGAFEDTMEDAADALLLHLTRASTAEAEKLETVSALAAFLRNNTGGPGHPYLGGFLEPMARRSYVDLYNNLTLPDAVRRLAWHELKTLSAMQPPHRRFDVQPFQDAAEIRSQLLYQERRVIAAEAVTVSEQAVDSTGELKLERQLSAQQ